MGMSYKSFKIYNKNILILVCLQDCRGQKFGRKDG